MKQQVKIHKKKLQNSLPLSKTREAAEKVAFSFFCELTTQSVKDGNSGLIM